MSDVSGGPGWWLASDGKWYPPETYPGRPPPPPDMSTQRSTIDDANAGQAGTVEGDGGTCPRGHPLAEGARYCSVCGWADQSLLDDANARQTATAAADAANGEPPPTPKPPIYKRSWTWVIVAVVAISAGTAAAAVTAVGGKASNSSTSTTSSPPTSFASPTSEPPVTTTTNPLVAVGQPVGFTEYGNPYMSVTLANVVDPAQASDSFITPDPGNRYVALQFVVKATGTSPVSEDIYTDLKVYDPQGQGYDGDFGGTTAGPGFPSGEIAVAPGGMASGWVLVQLPQSQPVAKVVFTPGAGFASVSGTWTVNAS